MDERGKARGERGWLALQVGGGGMNARCAACDKGDERAHGSHDTIDLRLHLRPIDVREKGAEMVIQRWMWEWDALFVGD